MAAMSELAGESPKRRSENTQRAQSEGKISASMAAFPRSDFLRAPVLATARPEAFKEWHHYVIHRPGWRLLVNFSLTSEAFRNRPSRLVPRVIVIAHDQRWAGALERFDDTELDVSADLDTVAIGGNRMTVGLDGYRMVIDLPERDIQGEVHLTPTSRPHVVNNQAVGAGRISWLFVPRLRADGWVRIGGCEHHLDGDMAYHDHNWGRFRWGDDFGWEWGSILPSSPEDPWSFVFSRITDRRRLHSYSQVLYVCHHSDNEPTALFCDAAIQVRSAGLLGRAPDCTLPPPMRLVLGGEASDVPASIEITATRSGDTVHAEFRPQSYACLAQPSEVRLDRSVALLETSGTVRISGSVSGKGINFVGAGVFELLHG